MSLINWSIKHTTVHLSSEQEEELVQLILDFCRAGFSLTTKKIRSLAYQYAQENKIDGFSKKTKKAGKEMDETFLAQTSGGQAQEGAQLVSKQGNVF